MERISVNQEQIHYIKQNYGKMRTVLIAKNLEITIGRLRANIRLLGFQLRLNNPQPKVLIPCNGMYNEAAYLLTLEVP